ncbi:hypothetical protein ccbrp13_56810 [Ktedonobacteria bacterium brp13]|nr:hypothetical protein ccbrp13_56810 [Ktedonobacteria bacterium brp13]
MGKKMNWSQVVSREIEGIGKEVDDERCQAWYGTYRRTTEADFTAFAKKAY